MNFFTLTKYFQELEKTSSRNNMVEILADLFKEAKGDEAKEIAYLSQGRVAPLFVPLEFGMADKMVIRAIAQAYERSNEEITRLFKEKGDLGIVAESLAKVKISKLSVNDVYEGLRKIAETGGEGSVELKITILASLLDDLDPLSARYLARIPVGRLRLGFSDMTVLEGLSWMLNGSKSLKPIIESAYNVCPDLGFICETVVDKGLEGLKDVSPQVGTPIMMARAERLSSGEEIIEKIGKCAIEPKIDGFRLAVHKNKDKIQMFTRNMEEVTFMYPDLEKGIREQIKTDQVIIEGEAVAYNPQTSEYLPFQETVQRKRKYDIGKKAEEVPLRLLCFDLLFKNGDNFIGQPYIKRREELKKTIEEGETLLLTDEVITDDPKLVESIFQDKVSKGLEGIVAKRLDGVYQAGARGWNWIKYKRSYQGKLEDTIDAVVMGYDFGQGKRTSFGIGDFLIGVYDQKTDTFQTIAKIGTGLTDEEWKNMRKMCDERKVNKQPARYLVDRFMSCDVWVNPEIVVTIRADEISKSPIHTAGRTPNQPGFALRFPRLISFRADKSPEDATTINEIEEMFQLQYHQAVKNKSEQE